MRADVKTWLNTLEPGTVFDGKMLPEGVSPQRLTKYVHNNTLRREKPKHKAGCKGRTLYNVTMYVPENVYGPGKPKRCVYAEEQLTFTEIRPIFGRDVSTLIKIGILTKSKTRPLKRQNMRWVKL